MIPASSIAKRYCLVRAPDCHQTSVAAFPLKHIKISFRSHDLLSMDSPQRSRICCFGRAFPNREKKTKKQKEGTRMVGDEPRSGGIDIVHSSLPLHEITPRHLVVMVNGLIGSASDWKFAAEQLVIRHPDKVIVHCSECNPAKMTFDGVDVMGERLADEVLAVVRDRVGLQKISFIAHSLGGLVARYAIGRLYQQPVGASDGSNLSMGRIAGLQPVNFVTFATPHLGSRGNKQLPFLCGLPFLERQASQTAHIVAGRSGKHLFLTDNDDGRPPLLLRMVSDLDDVKFIPALRSFKRRVAYANANFDHVVGWRTSCIRRQHELPKVDLLLKDTKYPHIVYTESDIPQDSYHQPPSYAEEQKIDYEEEMIRGLRQVAWERVDVSFHKSRQRYVAHNTIQVKSYWLNSDGADVICHMIDHFLL